MEEFIKAQSTIPHDFLDDFNFLLKDEFDEAVPTIDFGLLSKWLKVKQDVLKLLLTKHYHKGDDYIIRTKKFKKSRHNRTIMKQITISFYCFRRLCSLVGTRYGEEIVDNFAMMRHLQRKYHVMETKRLREKLEELKKCGSLTIYKCDDSDETIDNVQREVDERIVAKLTCVFDLRTSDTDRAEKCVKDICVLSKYGNNVYEVDFRQVTNIIKGCEGFMDFSFSDESLCNDDKRESIKSELVEMVKNRGQYYLFVQRVTDTWD